MRHYGGHDLYVTDASFAAGALVPRVLLRCSRCSCLGIGIIETQGDRDYAAIKDRQYDTGEWWDFEALRITGMADCAAGGAG